MDDCFDDGIDEDLLAAASENAETSKAATSLTDAQKNRAEKNRMKALALKKGRLSTQPYTTKKDDFIPKDKKTKDPPKLLDTNAGFFIEESDEQGLPSSISEPLPAPVIEPDRPLCQECQEEEIADSYLMRNFDLEVCDKCKETEKDGKHELITKTDAKNEFLLKDHDFDKEPGLKFILRKNPHNSRWGDMKLFLRVQVEKRALEIWGDEDALEAEHEKREEKRDQAKVKKFNKKLKALRMQVRGSLYKKEVAVHEHEYGEEVYDEDEDQYSRTCKTCNHVHSYEKM